jgi:hypothetical protein
MAKPGRKPKNAEKNNSTTTAQAQKPAAAPEGESISGYFRKVFAKNRKLLTTRSNQEVLEQWLKDHSGHTTVPENVKQGLANVKSVLRHKKRAKVAKTTPPAELAHDATVASATKLRPKDLESLEQQIDDCLMTARKLNEADLASVIRLLRQARNQVVWKLGE